MEIDLTRSLIIIAICFSCTLFERALPFLIFRGKEVPPVIKFLGKVLPMAIMATLIIYCIKGISFTATGGWAPYLIACGVTVLLHLWKSNTLLSIFGGTACYMVLVQMVFI
ncbi:MAG: AzlD domain-containing protein [Bacillota bacterium]|nr:AzlD domain-containing protein [Bacillota bacterium]